MSEGRNGKRPSELGEGRCKSKAEKEVSPEKAQVPLEENAIETVSSLPQECVTGSYWHIKRTIW